MRHLWLLATALLLLWQQASAPDGRIQAAAPVEPQPLAANVERLIEALDVLGAPLPADLRADLVRAGQARDAARLQTLLDTRVLLTVHVSPEARVRVARGAAPAVLPQAGYRPMIVKVVNESRGTQRMRIDTNKDGRAAAVSTASHQSGERDCRQKAHTRLT